MDLPKKCGGPVKAFGWGPTADPASGGRPREEGQAQAPPGGSPVVHRGAALCLASAIAPVSVRKEGDSNVRTVQQFANKRFWTVPSHPLPPYLRRFGNNEERPFRGDMVHGRHLSACKSDSSGNVDRSGVWAHFQEFSAYSQHGAPYFEGAGAIYGLSLPQFVFLGLKP